MQNAFKNFTLGATSPETQTPAAAPRFGVITAPSLSQTEAARLQAAFERATVNKSRFDAIMPKVREKSPDFAAKIEALPVELDGYNLAPLFEEFKEWHGDQWAPTDSWAALEYRERMWTPNLQNIGDSYNGPIGAHGEINYQHAQIWQLAKRHVEAQELAEFARQMESDIEIMLRDLVNDPLAAAAAKLLGLAFGVEGERARDCFVDSQTDEMPANLAALRLIRVALDELDKMCANSVIDRRQWVREEAARVEAISAEMGFAGVWELETVEADEMTGELA